MSQVNINRVVLTGNLTADPELRSLPSGTSVCKLRVACNTRRKDSASGEYVDKPNYFDVTVWGAQGENAARYLTKGRGVAIDGRLEWREWGNRRRLQAPGDRDHHRQPAVPRRPQRRGRRRAVVTQQTTSAPASRPGRDVLDVDARELRDTIRLTIDRELVDELDRRRGEISRSHYAEQLLTAALQREHPHLPDG